MKNVAIIGSGPAGYTAGIYAGRANLEPVLFEGLESGGQLMLTTDVENYPGFVDGIMGPELMQVFKGQAERFGTEIKTEIIDSIENIDGGFKLTSSKGEYEFKSVIIASGASARWLGVEGEKELQGYGVSACATCDGFFFKDQIGCIKRGKIKALTQQVAYKLYALAHLWETTSEVERLVMFGDDVEDDPFIFSLFRRILLGEIAEGALRDALVTKGVLESELEGLVQTLLSHASKLAGREILCVIRKVKNGGQVEYANGVLWVTRMTQAAFALKLRGFIGSETFVRVEAEDRVGGYDWSRAQTERSALNSWFG